MKTEQSETPKELRSQFAWAWEDAREHAHADNRCGRKWVCACGSCNTIRREVKRLYNNEGSISVSKGFQLIKHLGQDGNIVNGLFQ